MLFAIITWIIVLIRPRFVFLFACGAAMLVLSLPAFFAAQSREQIILMAIDFAVGWGILFLVGALIIVIRKWLESRGSNAEKIADQELARIRAEAAARDGSPPPA